MNAGHDSVWTRQEPGLADDGVHLDQAVLVVRRPEQDDQRVAGVVVGLRALSEDAEVVARQPVQVELLGQRLEVVALGVPDVEPEVLAACEPLLHLGQVDPFRGGPVGVHERPRHVRTFARRGAEPAWTRSSQCARPGSWPRVKRRTV